MNKLLNKLSNFGYRLQVTGNKVDESEGFIMPTIIILMVIMSTVAYATLIQANNGYNLSYKEAYIQMARSASKSAIDYAQEQFDNSNCGNYSGTPETDLTGSSNNRYKITMQTDVTGTSPDGFEKTIKGTGRVYLPKTSSSALYVFDVRSEIVRTYAVCKTPDNYAPLVWLDASNTASLKKTGTVTTTISPATTSDGGDDSTADTLEERADNGTQTTNSWQSSDFEMNNCDPTEFSNAVCNSNASKYLNIGMVFSGTNVPKNSTITSAKIILACTNPAGTSGALNERIYGFYKSAGNPHPDLFTSSGSNQLKTPLATANLHTTASSNVSSNNCPPGNNTVWDVTPVVQEVVNNPSWNPNAAGNGGRMGFIFSRTSGAGSRHLLKSGNLLSVSYSTTTVSQANNGDAISEWGDLSGHGYNAKSIFGNSPTRVDNQINAKTIVRFNSGAMVSTLSAALSGKREFTAFAVAKPNFGTSGASGRVISGMSTSGTTDTSGTNSIIPLRRQNNATGFSNYYADSASYETTMDCNPACASTPYLEVSDFRIDGSTNTITGELRGNGASQISQTPGINPGNPPPPYSFSLDQLYFGGRRSGAMPGAGADYFNGDYAEIVVYDKALSCYEIENLEDYFRAKWAIADSAWTDSCPPNQVPTL